MTQQTFDKEPILGFAIWHPEHGFHQPYHYEGPLVYVRSDDEGIMNDCKEMNRESGQDNRKGWRIVPVTIHKQGDYGNFERTELADLAKWFGVTEEKAKEAQAGLGFMYRQRATI
jgi:hypothetical protein